jgi:peptidoglycan/xylan/chitin deacetylase (PgdA/CDA1 family)
MTAHNRRHFLQTSARWGAAAGAVALSGRLAAAQSPTSPPRRPNRYDEDVLFSERKPFAWPGGARIAVWIVPNIEVFIFDPDGSAKVQGNQDVLNYSYRDYGMRIGLWRIADVMAGLGIRGTVALNAATCELFPQAIAELDKRGWEMMGHNVTNSRSLRNASPEVERSIIDTTLTVIAKATGKPVRGWLGSGLAETPDTLDILAASGVRYTGDWNNDDLPVPLRVKSGTMHGLPYGNQVNDIRFFTSGHTGEEYEQMLIDQFDTLYKDSVRMPRIMGIPLHPFHTGQALRIKYLASALSHIKKHDRVWFATGSEIHEAYLKAHA